jgi:hypothetical protein
MVTTEIRELSVEEMDAVAGGGVVFREYLPDNAFEGWIASNYGFYLYGAGNPPGSIYH